MASIDLQDVCLHIPIAAWSQKYLRLALEVGKKVLHLQFRALPFGLSLAPRVFMKVMAEALAPLRLEGISVIPYLDDLLFFVQTREMLQQNLVRALAHLESIGWILNLKKSNLVPSLEALFLGYRINSVEQKIGLPEEKEKKLVEVVSLLQSSQLLSIRKIMSALRTLISSIHAIQWARLNFRPPQSFVLKSGITSRIRWTH